MSSMKSPAAEEVMALRAAFVDTAARFCERGLAGRVEALDTVTMVAADQQQLRAAINDAGLVGMALAEAGGGMGLDAGMVGAVLARVACSCAGTAMQMWAHESALLALANGAVSVPEGARLGHALLAGQMLRAVKAGNGWRLDGQLPWVWGAGVASHVLVAAETDGGGVLALVPVDAAGVRVAQAHVRIGLRACPSQALDFDGVLVDGAPEFSGAAFTRAIAQARDAALVLVGAIAAGNARAAWQRAVGYARERYQGGDFIIEHNLVQGMLGNSLAQLRAAEALVEQGLVAGGDDAVLAHVVATRNGEQICLDAVQVFGGNGYMRDYGIEKRLRDAKMLALVGGNNERLLQALVAVHRHEEQWP